MGWRKTPPVHAHPLVRQLYTLARHHRTPLYKLAVTAGVNENTIYGWGQRYEPRMTGLIACYNALGYDLVVQRRKPSV